MSKEIRDNKNLKCLLQRAKNDLKGAMPEGAEMHWSAISAEIITFIENRKLVMEVPFLFRSSFKLKPTNFYNWIKTAERRVSFVSNWSAAGMLGNAGLANGQSFGAFIPSLLAEYELFQKFVCSNKGIGAVVALFDRAFANELFAEIKKLTPQANSMALYEVTARVAAFCEESEVDLGPVVSRDRCEKIRQRIARASRAKKKKEYFEPAYIGSEKFPLLCKLVGKNRTKM